MDAVTERQIYSGLELLRSTRVSIAHRLSTVRNADLILVLKEGAVVEQGSYQELMARQGVFAELARYQVESREAMARAG